MNRLPLAGLLLAAIVLATSCGKGDSAASPSPAPTPTGTTTITITSTGASPKNIVLPRGGQVTFVNRDAVPHQMYSDPHPEHTDCPEFDSVGFLSPGQSRQTKNLVTAGTCNFHDHGDASNISLRGSVVIQ